MTEQLFLKDAYMRECDAKITSVIAGKKGQIIRLDRTCFQPNNRDGGDKGIVISADEQIYKIINVASNPAKAIIDHTVYTRTPFTIDQTIKCQIDWKSRYIIMRKHTGNHLLYGCSKLISKGSYTALSKTTLGDTYTQWIDQANQFNESMINDVFRIANELIEKGSDINIETLPRKEALEKCGLYHEAILPKSVNELRVVTIAGVDSDPCIGLHVKNLNEIRGIRLIKVEQKGTDLKVFSDLVID